MAPLKDSRIVLQRRVGDLRGEGAFCRLGKSSAQFLAKFEPVEEGTDRAEDGAEGGEERFYAVERVADRVEEAADGREEAFVLFEKREAGPSAELTRARNGWRRSGKRLRAVRSVKTRRR